MNDDVQSAEIEKQAINLYHQLVRVSEPGDWEPSPVETEYFPVRDTLLKTPGYIRNFRSNFLASGRLNFPDSPRPKEHFLKWNNKLAGQKMKGLFYLCAMMTKLYKCTAFRFRDILDNTVGNPQTYKLPNSIWSLACYAMNHLKLSKFKLSNSDYYHFSEAQLRFFYYRSRIESLTGNEHDCVMEVGGGYGGLCFECLKRLKIRRYYIVELPDGIPLAYYYLSSCHAGPLQVLTDAGQDISHDTRIVIVPAWLLPFVSEQIDLFINTMSFQHMLLKNIRYYLSHLERLQAKYLYLVNRDTVRDPTDVILSNYPIGKEYSIVSRKPWLFGPHIEALYERLC